MSHWTQQYVPSVTNSPYGVILSDEAAFAVRQMGSNALPALLRWMRYPEHDLRLKLIESLQSQQRQRNRMFLATARLLTPKSYQPGSAVLAFQALGSSARGAVPALSQMLHEPRNARNAAMALCAIGPDGIAALGESLPTIGDGILRANILLEFYHVTSPELQAALSPLVVGRLREDPSAATRLAAAQILARFTHAAAAAVPTLAAALRDPDGVVRMVAADGLGQFGQSAVPAIPLLEAALLDQHPQVRISATNALHRIRGMGMPSNNSQQ
ncbi:MAG TPA: HEAT repeat domain-containing protein [Verrucomicrobiae bacterium]